MIHFHYNQDTIQAQHPSEAKFHRNFLLPLRDSELLGEEVHVYHSYFLGDHSNQLEGEIDFLIVCAFGVVVVEVKGGLIDYNNNNFYQTNRRTKKTEVIHPVKQVRANKASIRHLINKGLPVTFAMVMGKNIKAEAKIIGITPPAFNFKGR